MSILHSFIFVGFFFFLARQMMHKTAPRMLLLCGALLERCFLCFLKEPNRFIFFSPERKPSPHDPSALGGMRWWGSPLLGWHLVFALFCLLDPVSAFSLSGLNRGSGFTYLRARLELQQSEPSK